MEKRGDEKQKLRNERTNDRGGGDKKTKMMKMEGRGNRCPKDKRNDGENQRPARGFLWIDIFMLFSYQCVYCLLQLFFHGLTLPDNYCSVVILDLSGS